MMHAHTTLKEHQAVVGTELPQPHGHAQLLLAISGVTTVTVHETSYVLSPHRAIWIPAHCTHRCSYGRDARCQSVMLDPMGGSGLTQCRVFETTPLIRALTGEIACSTEIRQEKERQTAIADLLINEIRRIPLLPPPISLPRDIRLRRVCEAVVANPSDRRTLEDWARQVHMSRRAFTRLCKENLGIGFAAWRRRVRMMHAIARISSGEAITCVAYDVGYESPGAFAALFRKTFGETASNYCRR